MPACISLGMRQSPRGAEADRPHLGAVGHAVALELLGKEAPEEGFQLGLHARFAVYAMKRLHGQHLQLPGRRAAVHQMVEEKIMQGIVAQNVLGALLEFSL